MWTDDHAADHSEQDRPPVTVQPVQEAAMATAVLDERVVTTAANLGAASAHLGSSLLASRSNGMGVMGNVCATTGTATGPSTGFRPMQFGTFSPPGLILRNTESHHTSIGLAGSAYQSAGQLSPALALPPINIPPPGTASAFGSGTTSPYAPSSSAGPVRSGDGSGHHHSHSMADQRAAMHSLGLGSEHFDESSGHSGSSGPSQDHTIKKEVSCMLMHEQDLFNDSAGMSGMPVCEGLGHKVLQVKAKKKLGRPASFNESDIEWDKLSPEDRRRIRRRLSNRASAHRVRQRRTEMMNGMQSKIQTFQHHNSMLLTRLAASDAQRKALLLELQNVKERWRQALADNTRLATEVAYLRGSLQDAKVDNVQASSGTGVGGSMGGSLADASPSGQTAVDFKQQYAMQLLQAGIAPGNIAVPGLMQSVAEGMMQQAGLQGGSGRPVLMDRSDTLSLSFGGLDSFPSLSFADLQSGQGLL